MFQLGNCYLRLKEKLKFCNRNPGVREGIKIRPSADDLSILWQHLLIVTMTLTLW